MKPTTSSQNSFELLNIILLESNFKRDVEISYTDEEFKSNIDIGIENQLKDSILFVEVSLTYSSGIEDNKEIQAFIKMVGVFKCPNNSDLSTETFGKINAPAILFPFIRENLASVSMKAGISPILLPPVNFVKLSQK
ncbi:protein-export chaperone SecB [Bernardetia sp. MNP-M8]|uniref:protein-export chaperone SecB n=1 Tax=Bernardetia sp. MNP-M8 TaxID=3127470 RepID=UPI0030D3F116